MRRLTRSHSDPKLPRLDHPLVNMRARSKNTRSRIPMVIAIGGFDPSCGAGVVADARSIEAMGAMPLAVVTAITVQSGTGVRSFQAVPTARVVEQLEELLDQLP